VTTLIASSEIGAAQPIASESAAPAIVWVAASVGGILVGESLQGMAETEILTTLAWDPQQFDPLTARQQWLRMIECARERMATAPEYPDHPHDIAEQEAVTRALAAGQARAQAKS
jgi:hypothetical protein